MAGDAGALSVTERAGAVRFAIRVKPRASREALVGVSEGVLSVSVTAPPVDGQANEAVILALSGALGVPRRAVTIVAGDTGKQKIVEVAGVDARRVLAALKERGL